MDFTFRKALPSESPIAFALLKQASETLAEKNINQWGYWQDPPADKIQWIQEGFDNGEFYFTVNESGNIMGMFRLLESDPMYWGERHDNAIYLHSLVTDKEFAGIKLGNKVLEHISNIYKKKGTQYFRLDCLSTNPGLCQYYEKQGFKQVGTITLKYGTFNLYQIEL
jgi:ribosomal protein S18 acetylase RimI-like enzyme